MHGSARHGLANGSGSSGLLLGCYPWAARRAPTDGVHTRRAGLAPSCCTPAPQLGAAVMGCRLEHQHPEGHPLQQGRRRRQVVQRRERGGVHAASTGERVSASQHPGRALARSRRVLSAPGGLPEAPGVRWPACVARRAVTRFDAWGAATPPSAGSPLPWPLLPAGGREASCHAMPCRGRARVMGRRVLRPGARACTHSYAPSPTSAAPLPPSDVASPPPRPRRPPPHGCRRPRGTCRPAGEAPPQLLLLLLPGRLA